MMDDAGSAIPNSTWRRICNSVRSLHSHCVLDQRGQAQERDNTSTTGEASYTITTTDTNYPWIDYPTIPQMPVHSLPISASWSGGPYVEQVEKKCNYCGTETPDFRELRIGRMTTVVVCDMCMLKALSKTLEVRDGDNDGRDGNCECGGSEKDCRHGPKEEGEEEKAQTW